MRIDQTLLAVCLLFIGPALLAEESKPVLDELDEVLIVGKQPGPALWQVKSGDHTLWILAEVRLLPNKMKWRSKQVEKVVASAREVLAVYGSRKLSTAADKAAAKQNFEMWEKMRYLPGGKTLRDILPPEMYARFESAKVTAASRGKDLERLTPVAAQNRLWNDALRTLDLGLAPIAEKVVEMAKRRNVKVTQVAPLFLNGDPSPTPGQESFMNPCSLERTLIELDTGGARMKARTNAWSVGDVEKLKRLIASPPPLQLPQCGVRGGSAPTREDWEESPFSQNWLAAAERALATNSSTLAVVDASLLLSPGGLLEKLKGRGYEVIEP